jgi:uncharacterized protein (DUF1697 family)
MPRYAAFLRGINLGGRRVKNDRLRACFEDLGLDGVAVFRASGNVVFESSSRSPAKLSSSIEAGLRETLGYEVPTFLRSSNELLAIASGEPFSKRQLAQTRGRPQVALLLRKPSATARKEVLAMSTSGDRLAIIDRELYWLPRAGTQESQLDLKAIDDQLGSMTMRTMGTIEQLASKYFLG